MLRELREIVANTDVTRLHSSAATTPPTTCPSAGDLPHDKEAMLAALDKVLQAPASVQLRPESWRRLL